MGTITWIGYAGETVVQEDADSPTFDRMEEFLAGQTEHVTVLHNGKSCSMYVNEFGRRLWTDRNPTATEIYFAASKARGIDPEDKEQARKELEKLADSMGVKHENIHYLEDPETSPPPGIYGPAILLEGFE